MLKNLEEYLRILNSEDCFNNPKEAILIIEKIDQCLKYSQSEFTANLLIGLLLDENDALFSFIWKTCLKFETVSSASAALKLLESLLISFKEYAQPYFCNVFQRCLNLLDTKFAKVKELSLKIIKYLITEDSKLCLDLSKLTIKLDKYLREDSKMPGTVTEQTYCILGILFEKYPESTEKDGKCFFMKMKETLRRELTVLKNPSTAKIRGAFEGINGYLTSYSVPDNESIVRIYEFIKNLGKFEKENRTASRSAFKVFQNHWKHFSDLVFNDRDFWKQNLLVWVKQNSEDRQCGFNTLTAFYRMIALEVKKNPNEEGIVNIYLKDFMRILKSKESNSYEKRSALVGIKLFVLADCLNSQELNEAYQMIVELTQAQRYIFFPYLPLCIECVSAFVLKCSVMHEDRLICLQRLSVMLISEYPKIEIHFQSYALTAIEKSFYTLSLSRLESLDTHIDRVIYQGLIRSCSWMTVVDKEVLMEEQQTKEDFITYKSYLSLWKYLLNLVSTTNLAMNGSFLVKKGISVKVFDAYINSFLKIISKLNLNIKVNKNDLENEQEEPTVENPSDLRIFANCVDLYVDLVPFLNTNHMQKWLNKIFQNVIYYSHKNPLVAGFYKIMAATLKVADNLNFFQKDIQENKTFKCYKLVRAFLQEVVLKVDQYKTDLQVACLQAFLAAPACFVEFFAEKTSPVLEVVIRLGRGNFDLLKNMIETLERWNYHLPTNTINSIMQKILPHFDIFFQSLYFQGDSGCINHEGRKLKKTVFNDNELLTLQKRFLLFLGNLDVNTAMHLIELKASTEEERKVTEKKIVYYPPSSEASCEVNLDVLLPRIIELAICCSDRSTRLIACELLYSTVMIILSNINQMNGGFTAAFRKAMRSCLVLGCDCDSLVYQIFEPLMFQITHYFSMKKAIHFSETQDLIDILVEFVTCPYDPMARDFASLLIREYTIWSIKQLTPEELQVTPDSVNKILNNIYALSLHPNYSKRLGAAIIFNKIYSVLREEDFILSAYWFQLFYHFMECLRMCDGQEDVTEIVEAIQHIKRPLIEKHQEFNKSSSVRIVPPEFAGDLLCHLVKWTFNRCHDTKIHTRRIAMSLVRELAPLVTESESLLGFVSTYLPEKPFLIRKIFKGNEDAVHLLKCCESAFEYYTWLLSLDLITVDEAFELKFNVISKRFVTEISVHQKDNFYFDFVKRQSVLSFLTYLFALKNKAYYFRVHIWEMLKIAIFKPSEYGFDLNDAANMEKLSSLLVNLLSFFSSKLTHYEWDNFFDNLEVLISSPVLKQITRNSQVNTSHVEFLYGMNIVTYSGIWKMFTERTLYSIDGNIIIKNVFNSLFFKQGKNLCAISLEPVCKLYLEKFLKFGLKVGSSLRNLLQYVGDPEIVHEEETGNSLRKGQYFLLQFRNVIYEYLQSNASLLIDNIITDSQIESLNLLVGILQCRDADAPKMELAQEIFRRWSDFVELETKNNSFKKNKFHLFNLGASAAEVIGIPGFLKNTPFSRWMYLSLDNEIFIEMDIENVEKIFQLVPYFSEFGEVEEGNKILSAFLKKFFIDQYLFQYLEETESPEKKRIVIAMKGLLRSLKLSGSLVILPFFLRIIKFLEFFCEQEELESVLDVFSDPKMPCSQSMRALRLVYNFVFEKQSFENTKLVFQWFLIPLLEKLPNVVVFDFIAENIENICTLILSPLNIQIIKSTHITLQKKAYASIILKIFFFKMSNEELQLIPKEKRQCIDNLVKSSLSLINKEQCLFFGESYRLFMCELFNMICSIICARSLDHKIYKLFIFDLRGCFLLYTVSQDQSFVLSMDFDEIPKRKKYLTSLRKTITRENQIYLRKTPHSVKYIQTNTLFSSSLIEDVTKFDLTHSPIRPINSIEGYIPQQTSMRMEIELEEDLFNNHECMATLVGLVHKMVREKIEPPPSKEEGVSSLPCWLDFFVSVLKNPKYHRNLKLFILKAVYNVQEYIKPYCEEVFPVILDSVCTLFKNFPMNYFLMDLIEMMVEWRHSPQSEKSKVQLTDLVTKIITKSDSFRRDIVKNNLEILKMVVEVWKDIIVKDMLSFVCFERLSKSIHEDLETDFSTLDGITYINGHVCGIFLSNGITPWKKDSKGKFFNLILKGFHEKNRNREQFAEICGLALKYLKETDDKDLNVFEYMVRQRIECQCNTGLLLLYSVHKHYPQIVSTFIFKIFTNAWSFVDSLSVKYLEMLLSYASGEIPMEDDVFNRNSATFLKDMLNTSNILVHEIALQIAVKLFDKMEEGKLDIVMHEIVKMRKSTHLGVRKWVYEIAKKYYSSVHRNPDIRNQCKVVLLRGLNDGVKELEDSCLEFFQKTFNFSSSYSKLLIIFREMYTPEIEAEFLNIMAKVLLDSSISVERYHQPIFSNPITHECKFQKRNIILGIRKTLLSGFFSSKVQSNQSIEYIASLKSQCVPYKRETTSSLKFEPTAVESVKELNVTENYVPEEKEILKNSFRRRFFKSVEKTNVSIVRHQVAKKKKELKKEQDLLNNREKNLELIGEYSSGDYPNIQIGHFQVLKPLQLLAKKDHQIARQLLVSYYFGLYNSLNSEEKETLVSETHQCFDRILKTSRNFDPAVFGFVFQILLKHPKLFNIDCHRISSTAISSNCLTLGALIIEEIINSDDGIQEDLPKRRKGVESTEDKRWLELSRLYRNLKESDVLSGIFLDKLKVDGDAKKAIRCEIVQDWFGASEFYETLLKRDCESSESEFYMDSYFLCLEKLSDWTRLNECIKTSVDNDLRKMWQNHCFMSWFIKSEMMVSLSLNKRGFHIVLEDFCKKKSNAEFFYANFVEETAVFDLLSDKVQRASQKITRLCLDFLADWSHLTQWSYYLRATKLEKLQTLSELNYVVKTLADKTISRLEENIEENVKRWNRNIPTATDDLVIWDVKLNYRKKLLTEIKDSGLSKAFVKTNLALVKAALDQDNLSLAKEYLIGIKDNLSEMGEDLKSEYDYYFNLGKVILGRLKMNDGNVGIEFCCHTMRGILNKISLAMETESETSRVSTYRSYLSLGKLVSEILTFVTTGASQNTLRRVRSILKLSEEEDVVGNLTNKGMEYFESAKNLSEGLERFTLEQANSYFELSKYILKFTNIVTFSDFEKLAKYLLKAMSLGSVEARDLFACLLNKSPVLVEEEEEIFSEMTTICDAVPSWMFLKWINQLLASLSSSLFPFLKYIILRITTDYPNAIRYAYRLSKEKNESGDLRLLAFFSKLDVILNNKTYENFFNSMFYLGSPDLILKYHLESLLQKIDEENPDYEKIRLEAVNLYEIMFSPSLQGFRGPVFKFWDKFKSSIEGLMALENNQKVWKKRITDILGAIGSSKPPSKRTLGLLESYSPWLKKFHFLKEDSFLEMPGQYEVNHKPIKNFLITISSFKNSVIMFDSKCKPLRITVLGNDAIEHKFLIKIGEDLCQDQRIQQVFRYFNSRLKENRQTRIFSLDVFKVIPLFSFLGMIEWVDNNVSLHEVMEVFLGEGVSIGNAQAEHLGSLAENSLISGPVEAHLLAYEKISRETAISIYRQRTRKFPRDLLKNCFWAMSTSPEHFFYLRSNFAISHAVLCVTHWLVGIGDRHLQNTLISTKTGRVLGIDFGYAFGFATQFLTPPELVPFRLTPQILNLMRPLEEIGWIKQTMIHCLRLFRKENFVLLSILEVFALEPVMDWLYQAKKSNRCNSDYSENWYPRQKISMVQHKLNGANPVAIFETDLKAGHSQSRLLDKYLEVLKGVEEHNVRARCAESGLTEEEQVDCLIDLATDEHVLAKTYVGWNSWL